MKKVSIITIIVIMCLGYLYLKHQANESIQTNQEYIKTKVFGKDSEGRGYSDRAKQWMEEDLKLVNNDPDLRFFFDKQLKSERIMVLSKNKNEYMKNFNNWHNINNCIMNILIDKYPREKYPRDNMKYLNNQDYGYFESDSMKKLSNIVEEQFGKQMTFNDNQAIFKNAKEGECNEMLKNK